MGGITSRKKSDIAWKHLEEKFSNARGMMPRLSWLWGLSERISWKRMRCLEGQKAANELRKLTSSLSLEELAYLKERASVNLSEAQASMRNYVILNISAPVAVIFFINQSFPDFFATLLSGSFFTPEVLVIAVIFPIINVGYWYAHAGMSQARDLFHLLSVEHAARHLGSHLPADNHSQDLKSEVVES